MVIYPQQPVFRDTEKAFGIDDDDPEFVRDPTGLYAIYYGGVTPLLLQATETYGVWDVIAQIRAVHLEKVRYVINQVLEEMK